MKINTILAILQQSEYDYKYFVEWFDRNHDKNVSIKIEKETSKLKLLRKILKVLSFLPIKQRVRASLQLIKPIDSITKNLIIFFAKLKLRFLQLKGLKIVAISGSYAKTSTKHILDHLLSGELQVAITPKSINTPIGIANFVLDNLSTKDQLFVAELGEYYSGDITNLAKFIHPNFGIITPAGHQHLERMGSIENIAKTILELEKYFNDKSKVIIAEENKQFCKNKKLNFYGSGSDLLFHITNTKIDRRGTQSDIVFYHQTKHIFMPLFGEHQVKNALPSIWLAQQLDLDVNKVIARFATLPFISRRHEPIFAENNVLILDNSYNTNPDSFRSSLKLAKELSPSELILVTMGFIELGEQSEKIHYQLGKDLVTQVDYLGLINSPNAEFVTKGFLDNKGNKSHLVIGDTLDDTLVKASKFTKPSAIILIEGGYREIYN